MKKKIIDFGVIVGAIVFCGFSFILLREFLDKDLSNFGGEIISAVLGTCFTVVTLTVLMRLQANQDQRKDFKSKLFDEKIKSYNGFIEYLFSACDDNLISKEEVMEIENKIGKISLVGGAKLVGLLSQFLVQLEIYGCIYPRSMSKKQRAHFAKFFSENIDYFSKDRRECFTKGIKKLNDHFDTYYFVSLDDIVQGIREDLNVVNGDIKDRISKFVELPIDPFKLMRNPNFVD